MRTTIVSFALVLGASAAWAQDTGRVSLTVKGEAKTTADSVEVEFTVSARGEESKVAESKFRERLADVMKALKEGKASDKPRKKEATKDGGEKKKTGDDDEDAPKKPAAPREGGGDDGSASSIPYEVTERALAFGVKAAGKDDNPFKALAKMGGGAAPNPDPPMQFQTHVVATIKNVKDLDQKKVARRVAQLIDLGIDAGADSTESGSAPPPAVHFVVADQEALHQAAYVDAMSKASARAKKLVALGGRTLGPVSSVHESSADTSASLRQVTNVFGGATSEPLGGFDVTVEVELTVDFDIPGGREQGVAPGSAEQMVKDVEAINKLQAVGLITAEQADAAKKKIVAGLQK